MQQLDGSGKLRGTERIVARAYGRGELDKPGPQTFTTGIKQPAHRRSDRLRIDHQLPGELQLDQPLSAFSGGPGELALELDGHLTLPRTVELDREDRLPAPEDEIAFLDQEGGERAQQQLPTVRVPVDRLVQGDVEAAREVVVLVPGPSRSQPLEQAFEVPKQKGLVFVDREAERGVQRLEMGAPGEQAGASHLVPDLGGDVDKLGGMPGREFEPCAAQRTAPSEACSSCRAAGAG